MGCMWGLLGGGGGDIMDNVLHMQLVGEGDIIFFWESPGEQLFGR